MKLPFAGRRGFTLVEILIAVSIIALLIFIPFFAFGRTLANARDNERKESGARIQAALEQYKSEKGLYPNALQDLVDEGYLTALPKDPFEGREVPGSDGTLIYSYEENYSTENGQQWYTLIVPLEEEETVILSGGEEEQRKMVVIYTPEGPVTTGIPPGGSVPTATLRPSTTIIPTSNFSPTPTATYTPSPTLTYTPTPTASLTPTITPTSTPSPTPRRCWGTNGNCDAACTIVTGNSSWSGYYTTCTGPSACWHNGTSRCVSTSTSSASEYVQKYLNSSSCSANGIGFRWSGADSCSTNGSGSCYLFNATCGAYTFQSNGNMYERTIPGNTCSGPFGYIAGGGTFTCQGTVQQCSWGVSGACGTNLSGVVNQPNVADIGNCSTDGSGSCRKALGGALTNSGYDQTTSTTSCTPLPRYTIDNLQLCTWYEN